MGQGMEEQVQQEQQRKKHMDDMGKGIPAACQGLEECTGQQGMRHICKGMEDNVNVVELCRHTDKGMTARDYGGGFAASGMREGMEALGLDDSLQAAKEYTQSHL
eukprot:gnl/TRDRNA2_/TRDRNA2_163029_c0_seq1.p3 gnl/TRDRNA2_/TRDRNA2_163029_c0~~gnl/TRDRNA2_/TRDRNA2_163029_c0_seq1.p3  ORF type:complete len:105 (+),score=23.90 gnl/TRDRNA2_/TRDRNA2_163029_c0_seq1:298-612(+)